MNNPSNETIVAYLLNALSTAERESFEQQYLVDETLFARLLYVEEELIQRYVCGELIEREKKLFEAKFLKSQLWQERVIKAQSRLLKIESSGFSLIYACLVNPRWPRLRQWLKKFF